VLGAAGIARNGTSNITGNVGSYPTAAESGTGQMVISGGSDHAADSSSSAAHSGLTAAYADGSTRPGSTIGGALEGDGTIYPGVYSSLSGAYTLAASATLTLDGNGDTSSVFIFQSTAALTTGASTIISLINGAQAQNVFWVIGSDATLGATSTFSGSILATGAITVGSGATVTGRILAEGGLVSLDTDTITNTFVCPPLAGSPTFTFTPLAGSATSTFTPTVNESATGSFTPTVNESATGSFTPTVNESATSSFTPTAGSSTATPSPTPGVVSPLPVALQGADGYSILAGSGITNSGPSSSSGYVGTYPTTSETGFESLSQTCTNYAGGTFTQTAKNDLTTAYNDAQGRTPTNNNVGSELGGQTLPAGVYRSVPTGTSYFQVTGTLTLDGGGDSNAVFIFQADSTLTTANNSTILLTNSAQAKNVFWAVGSSATLGTGTNFVGTILAYTSITVNSGSTITGRLLALNGAVTVGSSTINTASVSQAPCNDLSATPTPHVSITRSSTSTRTPVGSTTASATRTLGPAPAAWPNSYFYPSPAKGDEGAVAYDLRHAGTVTLRVYNQTGRLVDTIRDSKPAGWQSSKVSVGKFASGVYYYILYMQYTAEGTSETQTPRKFVVAH
jgi:hypothetical protein